MEICNCKCKEGGCKLWRYIWRGVKYLWRNVTRGGGGRFLPKIVWRHLWTALKYTILSNYEQNTHFIQIAPCFRGNFLCFGMLQVRENEISLRSSWWSWVFAHLKGNIADDTMQMDVHKTLYPFYTTKKILRVTVRITKKRFVGSNSQVY